MIPLSKPYIDEAEKKAVIEVLESGMLVQGSRTAELEAAFAAVCGVKHAIATSSGTAALHLALLAHGIGKGDEVITTSFTFIASANSVIYTGAKPIFVDIEEETFNLDPYLIEKAITPRTRAILPVHLYGYPCNMEAIMDIAERRNLIVIEDAAQAVGAEYKGKPVGSFGTGCFSLYATKNITSGEGGMITTNDDSLAQCCRMLRSHGMKQRYYHETLGYNLRMTDLHAAIGLVQISRLGDFTAKRRANAEYLNSRITKFIIPRVRDGYGHVWHQYTIRVKNSDRDSVVKRLNDVGIGTGVFYPIPVHKQPHMIGMSLGDLCLPVSERLSAEVLSLPVHPQLSPADLQKIVTEVNSL